MRAVIASARWCPASITQQDLGLALVPVMLLLWVARMVRSQPATEEAQVPPLGWEDLLQKEMATHFSILAWEILWTEEPGRPQSMQPQRVGHN